jgi:hypothetical protein
MAAAADTNYYIKDTQNGTDRNIWAAAWVTPGVVTLVNVTNVAAVSLATPSAVRILHAAGVPASDGYVDWIRFRSVYDNTATVTVDPTGTNIPTSPYIWQRLRPGITPRWFPWSMLFFPRESQAGILDWRIEQAAQKTAVVKDRSFFISKEILAGRVTATRTPTRGPSPTPTANVSPTLTPTPEKAATKVVR